MRYLVTCSQEAVRDEDGSQYTLSFSFILVPYTLVWCCPGSGRAIPLHLNIAGNTLIKLPRDLYNQPDNADWPAQWNNQFTWLFIAVISFNHFFSDIPVANMHHSYIQKINTKIRFVLCSDGSIFVDKIKCLS